MFRKTAPKTPPTASAEKQLLVAVLPLFKALILSTAHPESRSFAQTIDRAIAKAESAEVSESDAARILRLVSEAVETFSKFQAQSVQSSLDDAHRGVRDVLASFHGALQEASDLREATDQSRIQLEGLEGADYQTVAQGIRRQVGKLGEAIKKHKANEAVIRKVCAGQIESLRTRLKAAETLTLTDPLTQFLSLQGLNKAIESARNSASPLSIALLELTDLQSINARHGYLAGDAALSNVADLLKEAIGKSRAQFARVFGDKFVVIYHGDVKALSLACGRVVEALATYPMKYGSTTVPLSATYVTQPFETVESATELVDVAHKRLKSLQASYSPAA